MRIESAVSAVRTVRRVLTSSTLSSLLHLLSRALSVNDRSNFHAVPVRAVLASTGLPFLC